LIGSDQSKKISTSDVSPNTITCGEKVLESIYYQIIGMRHVGATYTRISELLDINVNMAQKVFYRWEKTESGSSAP
jgi:hypothetical protein